MANTGSLLENSSDRGDLKAHERRVVRKSYRRTAESDFRAVSTQ
jgi:hypothetical protein